MRGQWKRLQCIVCLYVLVAKSTDKLRNTWNIIIKNTSLSLYQPHETSFCSRRSAEGASVKRKQVETRFQINVLRRV